MRQLLHSTKRLGIGFGTVNRLQAEVSGSNPCRDKSLLLFPTRPDRLCSSFPRVKQSVRDINLLPISGAKVENEWS